MLVREVRTAAGERWESLQVKGWVCRYKRLGLQLREWPSSKHW